MIAISGLFSALFLSPFLVVVLVVVAAIVARGRRPRPATWILSIGAGILLVLSLPVTSNFLLRPLEYRYPPIAADTGGIGAVVVLGAGVRSNAPDESGSTALSQPAIARVTYGYRVARRLDVPIVVSGGTTWRSHTERTEAETARDFLVALGEPVDRVLMESRSRTTRENAQRTAELLGGRGVTRVALVTSAWHMPRAMKSFARAGMECVPAPTDYLSGNGPLAASDFLPSYDALRDTFVAFREYFGLVLYAAAR
jgi:uncharacterized SAM-binding protein YcdF (DUF218 family)